MRKPLVMGNWKLNGTKDSVKALVTALLDSANKASPKADVAVCAPAVFIDMVENLAQGSSLKWGSEDCDIHTQGAYTGENSPVMLREFGCTYAIVGHSERRDYHKESSEYVAQKYKCAQENGLIPVLCVGESEKEFDEGKTMDVIREELKAVIDLCGIKSFEKAVIAYEPIWAIGTGKTATADQAEEIHAFIRGLIEKKYGKQVAEDTTILYGGSCKPSNAKELFAKPDVDGGLIGGAALEAESFMGIVKAF